MLRIRTAIGAQDVLIELRAQLLQVVLGFIAIASGVLFIGLVFIGQILTVGAGVAIVATILPSIGITLVRQRRYINLIGILTLGYLLISGVSTFSGDIGIAIALATLTTVTAALTTNRLLFWVINALAYIEIIALWLSSVDLANTAFIDISLVVVLALLPLFTSVAIRRFIVVLLEVARNAENNAQLLQASADVGQIVAQELDQQALLQRAVDIIRDRFGYYHVQIFLIEENSRYALLTASTGTAGQKLLARGHRLPLDSSSIIGRVSIANEPIIARDVLNDPYHTVNELLPNTRSQLALPINEGQAVLGALDVQSTQVNAFSDREMQALRVITSQLATALRNARLFTAQARNVEENKRLFIESETNLREIQRLNRQLTRQAWTEYLQGRATRVNGVTLHNGDLNPNAEWSERMQNAGRRRRPLIENQGQQTIATVPIELRGEVIGAIEVETGNRLDSDDLQEMMQAISQRLAVSIDNARLFEETQESTAQEQKVGEIVSQYQSAETVDELLKSTLLGLAQTLGAKEGSIRLGTLPDSGAASTNGRGHANGNGGASE